MFLSCFYVIVVLFGCLFFVVVDLFSVLFVWLLLVFLCLMEERESEDQSKGANLGLVTESVRVVHDVTSLGLAGVLLGSS